MSNLELWLRSENLGKGPATRPWRIIKKNDKETKTYLDDLVQFHLAFFFFFFFFFLTKGAKIGLVRLSS